MVFSLYIEFVNEIVLYLNFLIFYVYISIYVQIDRKK